MVVRNKARLVTQEFSQVEEFGDMMSRKFEISMIEELSYCLRLQTKQLKDGTFVS